MKGFEGYYVKCNTKTNAIAFIFGRNISKTNGTSFIQIITENNSYYAEYNYSEYTSGKKGFEIKVGDSYVNLNRMVININKPNLKAFGEIKFQKFTPIKYDAMGPFKFLPFMECRHLIISMHHKLSGKILLNEKSHNFNNGYGYIEGDRGKSFPIKYFWSQYNNQEISIFASCAIIPYLKIRFKGTICIIKVNGREYRIATYLGAKVKNFNQNILIVEQGFGKNKYQFEVQVIDDSLSKSNQSLLAPCCGKMNRTIKESLKRSVKYKFKIGGKIIFNITSNNAAYEYSDIST